MQIVIDIPKSVIEHLKDGSFGARIEDRAALIDAVMSGTPLPEHHGRLGDLDDLEAEMINGIKAGNYEEGYEKYQNINNIDDCVECVHFADTIIEGSESK